MKLTIMLLATASAFASDAIAVTTEDEDAAIEARFEHRTLCNFALLVVPVDRGPSLTGCTEDLMLLSTAEINAEHDAFWAYWKSSEDQEAKNIISRYPSFRANALHARKNWGSGYEMTTADIRKLDDQHLCHAYAYGAYRAKAASELSRRKLLSATDMRQAAKGVVVLGMSELAVHCALGKPDDINRSVGAFGEHKQFVYGSGVYVYVENGKVTSWQD